MPEWLIFLVVIWFFFGVLGRRARWGCGSRHRRLGTAPGAARFESRSKPRPRQVAPPPPETAEQRLQRQFVEGRLTMEEYETELAKVILRQT